MLHTVKRVAQLAGVSIRTLHYYDEIGLLSPVATSEAGYRLYAQPDLERLQQILFFRELGLSLKEIRRTIDSPGFDRRRAMLEHRGFLATKRKRLDRLIRLVDETIAAMDGGTEVDEESMFAPFDEKQIEEYRKEAGERWGRERVDKSYRRLAKLSRAEQRAVFAKGGQIELDVAGLIDRDPEDPEVQAVIDRWYKFIDRAFYDMTPEIFRGLGDMYVRDERFAAHYEAVKPGLARFMRAAMQTYCDRLEGGGPRPAE